MKRYSSIVLAFVLMLSTTAATCTKESLVSNASDVLSSLQSAQPLINQLVPSAGPRIAQAISIATKLKDAIAASDSNTAVGYLADLLPVFGQIVDQDINSLTAAQKTTILSVLALADIALHYIVRNLQRNIPLAVGPRASVIAAFDKQPVWGTRFKK